MRQDTGRLRIALLSYKGRQFSGGQGVYVRNLSRELVAIGHTVDVIAGPPYPVVDHGVRLTRLPSLQLFDSYPFRTPSIRELRGVADLAEYVGVRRGTFAEPLSFSLRAANYLARNRTRFDVVHDNQCLGYGLLGPRALGLAVLATVHHPISIDRDLELAAASEESRGNIVNWYRFVGMQGRVARILDRVATPSRASKDAIVEHFGLSPGQVDVVPLGVDTATFHPAGDQARMPGRIVATASADVALKGLDQLVRSCALLRAEHDRSHLELVVVGRPRAGGPAEKAITEHGIADLVSFRADLTEVELAALLRSAEVVCVPARYEGFSLPALEAMACGTPVVATDVGALSEVLGSAGVLVPPGDPDALAQELSRVLTDGELRGRLAAAGVARATEFTWRVTAQATVECYRELLAGSATRC
ncbi:MAG: glycosyltransferase family 4 protein [Sciscionella sp.]